MAADVSISVTVSPEAAGRVADLGMQPAFERMLEHARKTLPGLRALEAVLAFDPEGEDEPRVIILAAICEAADPEADSTEWDFARWKTAAFPPLVASQFLLMTVSEAPNGR